MMKRSVIFVVLLFIGTVAISQVTPRPIRADIKTPHATCEPCKQKIEAWVSRSVDGLIKINVQIKRGITSVQYYPDRTNIEILKTAISNAGFDADDVLANPDTYKKLPDCCKRPEEQKTPPAPKKD